MFCKSSAESCCNDLATTFKGIYLSNKIKALTKLQNGKTSAWKIKSYC